MDTFSLCLHPFLASYLSKETEVKKRTIFNFWKPEITDSKQKQWSKRFKIDLEVRAMSSYTFMEHRFFNAEEEELEV